MRHCRKKLSADPDVYCAKVAGHEESDTDTGCCAHLDTMRWGKTSTGRLRRKCRECGETMLVAHMVGQEVLSEYELCDELHIIAHSDIKDYVINVHEDGTFNVDVREGVAEDATRAIASVYVKITKDRETGRETGREVRFTLWPKPEAIITAGKRYRAFPTRWEMTVEEADRLLGQLHIPVSDLPPGGQEGEA